MDPTFITNIYEIYHQYLLAPQTYGPSFKIC